jgi:hypothetical protein
MVAAEMSTDDGEPILSAILIRGGLAEWTSDRAAVDAAWVAHEGYTGDSGEDYWRMFYPLWGMS